MPNSPALACPAPIFAPAPQRASPWTASLASPQSTFSSSTGLSSSGPSAFTAVSPTNSANSLTTSTATIYNRLMCIPKLLQEISNNKILRTRMNNTAYKPIPNNEKVDLARFRVKDPNEWLVDDVVAWMLDVAKRHNIPFEEMNMHKFSMLSGQEMLTMSEDCFLDRDPVFGNLIFSEFRKALDNSEDTTLDTVIGKFVDDEVATTSAPPTIVDMTSLGLQPMMSSITSTIQPSLPQPPQLSQLPVMQHQLPNLSSLTQVLSQQTFNPTILTPQQTVNAVQSLNQSLNLTPSLASSLAAGLTSGLSPLGVNYLPNGLNPASPLLAAQMPQPKLSPEMLKYSCTISTDYELPEDRSSESNDLLGKVRKNKDGKPRKRSQHTKGNKLWEFIRDALKDPSTCPSVVRWEDPVQGVFRIVESERLARLWGARKNNEKMTYEKLSRAMRTYYEKQILVPVPKTGMYPKKLVYKFGPGAHGWENVKVERFQ
uniref:Ets-domain protein n=1 Tax=Caenorhabditis tropicalis TaxID=1561998 RepID=A0A1I7T9S7_9PELO